MIFLAERAVGQKRGGQALLGGLDICVSRNFFGAQINSFEVGLPAHADVRAFGGADTFRAVFIRAPAVLEAGPGVEVLATYTLSAAEAADAGRADVAVAVRRGPLLATAFHPELTTDLRWHQLFVAMVRAGAGAAGGAGGDAAADPLGRAPTRPGDLPVYGQAFMKREDA